MAEQNSGVVAVVAIIAILLLIGGAIYFITGGTFNFKETNTTVVQPVTPSDSGAAETSTTTETTTAPAQ